MSTSRRLSSLLRDCVSQDITREAMQSLQQLQPELQAEIAQRAVLQQQAVAAYWPPYQQIWPQPQAIPMMYPIYQQPLMIVAQSQVQPVAVELPRQPEMPRRVPKPPLAEHISVIEHIPIQSAFCEDDIPARSATVLTAALGDDENYMATPAPATPLIFAHVAHPNEQLLPHHQEQEHISSISTFFPAVVLPNQPVQRGLISQKKSAPIFRKQQLRRQIERAYELEAQRKLAEEEQMRQIELQRDSELERQRLQAEASAEAERQRLREAEIKAKAEADTAATAAAQASKIIGVKRKRAELVHVSAPSTASVAAPVPRTSRSSSKGKVTVKPLDFGDEIEDSDRDNDALSDDSSESDDEQPEAAPAKSQKQGGKPALAKERDAARPKKKQKIETVGVTDSKPYSTKSKKSDSAKPAQKPSKPSTSKRVFQAAQAPAPIKKPSALVVAAAPASTSRKSTTMQESKRKGIATSAPQRQPAKPAVAAKARPVPAPKLAHSPENGSSTSHSAAKPLDWFSQLRPAHPTAIDPFADLLVNSDVEQPQLSTLSYETSVFHQHSQYRSGSYLLASSQGISSSITPAGVSRQSFQADLADDPYKSIFDDLLKTQTFAMFY